MVFRFLIIFQFVIITLFFSCKAPRQLATTSVPPRASSLSAAEDYYISTYKDIAVKEMKRAGIPASITLAQGMIESDYGRSSLAKAANNHFGIKCHRDWAGQKVYHHDDRRNECFRKYNKPEDSFYDHSEFLKSGSRYDFLFDLSSTDYKAWAHGLKKAGYATNPDYANMLIRKIEERNLHYYDIGYKAADVSQSKPQSIKEQVIVREADRAVQPEVKASMVVRDTGKTFIPVSPVNEKNMVAARVPRVMENNRLRYIIVKDGDTKEKLEDEFELLRWELSAYNDLNSDFRITPGQILYLQPKREKAEEGKDFYTVTSGDTMYLISQRYGIKLRSLYKLNRMEESTEPEPGSMIWLRNIKPIN